MSKHRHHRISRRRESITTQEVRERLERIDDLYWRGQLSKAQASANTAKLQAKLAELEAR